MSYVRGWLDSPRFLWWPYNFEGTQAVSVLLICHL